MKEENDTLRDSMRLAAARIASIDELTEDILQTLADLLEALRDADDKSGAKPRDLLTKLNELHAVHLRVLAAEESFNAKFGKASDEDSVDFEAVRFEIGRQLDRIRASLIAASLSGGVEL